jgi:hypothetical protein
MLGVFMRFLLVMSLILNSHFFVFAKPTANLSGQEKVNRQLAEEKNIKEFIELWNNSPNTKMLLEKMRIEPQELKRIESDLRIEKIIMQKPPQLEYWPQYKTLWMHFETGSEKLLLVQQPNLNDLPVIYVGYQFLKIQSDKKITDLYFDFKKQMKESLKEQKRLENLWNKKNKRVSNLDLYFEILNPSVFAGVVSVPFTSDKKSKTNWTPWIVLGSVFGALALWKGGEYLYKNYSESPQLGESMAAPDIKKNLDEGRITNKALTNSSVLDNQIVASQKEVVPTGVIVSAAENSSPIIVQSLDPMVDIDKNLKKLEIEEKLFVRSLFCNSKEGGDVFVVERINSNPVTSFGVSSRHADSVALVTKIGAKNNTCYYNYLTTNFEPRDKSCPSDKDKELMFTQGLVFKDLKSRISECCNKEVCKVNLQNHIDANIKRIFPTDSVNGVDQVGSANTK